MWACLKDKAEITDSVRKSKASRTFNQSIFFFPSKFLILSKSEDFPSLLPHSQQAFVTLTD